MSPLLAALFFLSSLSGAGAAGDDERLADVVIDACISPKVPAAWITVAEDRAKASGWVPDSTRSGPKFGLAHSVEEERIQQPVWEEKAWFIKSQQADPDVLDISVSFADIMPASSCSVLSYHADSKGLTAALQTRLALGKPQRITGLGKGWALSGDTAKPNENARFLIVTEQEVATGPGIIPREGGITIPAPIKTLIGVAVISSAHKPKGQ